MKDLSNPTNKLLKILNVAIPEMQKDDRFGIWVEDNSNKNQAIKILTIVDLGNWLTESSTDVKV